MKKGIVDRIEGKIAVCEWDDKTMEELALEIFHTLPKEGDVIFYENGKAEVLKEETIERKKKMESMFARLKKK